MKEKKYKPVDFTKAMKDIKTMLLATHDIKEIKKFYDYEGEDISHYSILATNCTIKEDVCEKGAKYHKERGRELLYVILMKVFQLGYNQAKIEEENDDAKNFLLEMAHKMAQEFKTKKTKNEKGKGLSKS